MFKKGKIRDNGIDITIKNNPDHFLSPSDWNMVMGVKLGRIEPEEFRNWYKNLIQERWKERKQEFIDLAKEGIDKEIVLKCFCPMKDKHCHAYIAADVMNGIIKAIKKDE